VTGWPQPHPPGCGTSQRHSGKPFAGCGTAPLPTQIENGCNPVAAAACKTVKSWIGNPNLGPEAFVTRRLFVDFNSRVRDESKNEVAANPLRLGRAPKDGRYESPDTPFRVSLAAP
jgi:hypothetical protein